MARAPFPVAKSLDNEPLRRAPAGDRAAARLLVLAGAVAVTLLPSISPATAQSVPEPRLVVEGLEFPTGIAFDSRGDMYVNEREGRIRVVRGGALDPEPLAEIPTIVAGETGLLGIAVAPAEDSVYVFATEPTGEANRILRVPLAGGEPEVVVPDLPAGGIHNGGGVAFDPEGRLLVTNGEQGDSDRAQDPQVLGGKVYRFTASGEVPADNPFGGPALAIGLRNPYGLAVDPISGAPFVTDNGPSSNDEVNRIVAGGNYGWPLVMGNAGSEFDASSLEGSYQEPLVDHPEIIVPTGIAFASPDAPGVGGDLFFAAYGEQSIHRVELNEDRTAAISDEVVLRSEEPVIALAWGPRGLYFSTLSAVSVLRFGRATGGASSDPGDPVEVPTEAAPSAPDGDAGGDALTFALAALAGAGVAGLAYSILRRRDRG